MSVINKLNGATSGEVPRVSDKTQSRRREINDNNKLNSFIFPGTVQKFTRVIRPFPHFESVLVLKYLSLFKNDDGEEDFSSMTCSSRQTEEIAAQQKRRQERQNRVPSEGYPGLAFGSGFSSNTMMRLRIIANELHNISSVQLKRAEGAQADCSLRKSTFLIK